MNQHQEMSISYDLIIVSQSSAELIPMTQQTIDSARQDDCDLNIIIIETGQPYKYDVSRIIEYNGQFCYNRALNLGLKHSKGDVAILANNDLVFHEGWSAIGELMILNDFHSASALSPSCGIEKGNFVYEGYLIGSIFTGWCLFMDRYCRETIGKLDESVNFWYSDNIYALQLQKAGIRHGLFCNIHVDHLTSRTLVKQPPNVQRQYQRGEQNKYFHRKEHYGRT